MTGLEPISRGGGGGPQLWHVELQLNVVSCCRRGAMPYSASSNRANVQRQLGFVGNGQSNAYYVIA